MTGRTGWVPGESWLDAALRVPDRFTLTREAAQRGGYHSPSTGTGQASAVDVQAPSQCGSCVAGLPMACSCRPEHPGAVRVELGHDGYTLERDDTGAFLNIPDPRSIQIGDPPVNVFSDDYARLVSSNPRPRSATDRLLSTADDQRRQAQALRQARQILAAARVPADIVMRRPAWRPGDVIVVEYAPGKPYTYVRGEQTWPVDKGRTPKTDADIDKLWDNGQVRPVLQSGGVPFAPTRLP